MNKYGKTGILITLMTLSLIAFLAVAVVVVWGITKQTQISQDTQIQPGEATVSLVGKAATLSVNARDKAADDVTTRATVPVYIKDPQGVWIETGGTSTSTTTSQAFTAGISVSNTPYQVLAFNASFQSSDGPKDFAISDEAKVADVSVYRVANQLELILFDKDNIATLAGNSNLSLGAGETSNFNKLRIRVNQTNVGYNLYGFFWDMNANTNISSISMKNGEISIEPVNSLPLARTQLDDLSFKLTTPLLMYEFDDVETGNIVVQADGDNPPGVDAAESFRLYAVDAAYYYSAKGEGVKFGPESDATSPADVGSLDAPLSGNWI